MNTPLFNQFFKRQTLVAPIKLSVANIEDG